MTFLVNDFLTLFFIFIRVTAMLFTAPAFSSNTVSTTAKLFFSLTFAYILFFIVKPNQIAYNVGYPLLITYAFKEALTGMIMGFSLNFVFYGISYAGSQMGMDLGLSMAQMFDPSTEVENNVIGQVLNLAAILVFFTIDGHHILIRGLAVSFNIIPLGHYSINESVYLILLKYSAGIFIIAIKIAAPVMVAFFLMHTAAGIISRIIPQMQVFFVMQPLQIILGLGLLSASAPIFIMLMKYMIEQLEGSLYNLLTAMGY
ncbi:MAG: flagellar biosynthetic protein FliR [Ignavibacteriales bacterium]|nr:flagellar biosynthetic protein FliR [Ignavibacteriales bacterium]